MWYDFPTLFIIAYLIFYKNDYDLSTPSNLLHVILQYNQFNTYQ